MPFEDEKLSLYWKIPQASQILGAVLWNPQKNHWKSTIELFSTPKCAFWMKLLVLALSTAAYKMGSLEWSSSGADSVPEKKCAEARGLKLKNEPLWKSRPDGSDFWEWKDWGHRQFWVQLYSSKKFCSLGEAWSFSTIVSTFSSRFESSALASVLSDTKGFWAVSTLTVLLDFVKYQTLWLFSHNHMLNTWLFFELWHVISIW